MESLIPDRSKKQKNKVRVQRIWHESAGRLRKI